MVEIDIEFPNGFWRFFRILRIFRRIWRIFSICWQDWNLQQKHHSKNWGSNVLRADQSNNLVVPPNFSVKFSRISAKFNIYFVQYLFQIAINRCFITLRGLNWVKSAFPEIFRTWSRNLKKILTFLNFFEFCVGHHSAGLKFAATKTFKNLRFERA